MRFNYVAISIIGVTAAINGAIPTKTEFDTAKRVSEIGKISNYRYSRSVDANEISL